MSENASNVADALAIIFTVLSLFLLICSIGVMVETKNWAMFIPLGLALSVFLAWAFTYLEEAIK